MAFAVVAAALVLGSTALASYRQMVHPDAVPAITGEGRAVVREQEPGPGIAPTPAVDSRLQSQVEDCLDGRSGVYGVAIRDLDTGQTVLVNAEGDFLSASTYKLVVVYRVYQEMEAGRLSADDTVTITPADTREGADEPLRAGDTITVADALESMITVSSNTAAYVLARLVGGWDTVDAAAVDIGMSATVRRGGYHRTSPADMLTFFQALEGGRLVSANASRSMLELLLRQKVNDRIPALLPDGTAVAHKTGELAGVRNDAGIVYGPAGRFAIAVLSRRADVDEATEVIADVARLAYDRYAR